jgi:hypothetical protein
MVEPEAKRRTVDRTVVPTAIAIERLKCGSDATNAILHVTC